MRDPGTPRRNPFFEHGSEGSDEDFGMGWRDDDPVDAGSTAGASEIPFGAAGGFGALLALVEGLSDAQPEAAEHLVAAAHEVVLTVKVLVDATEAVLAEQRNAMAIRSAMRAQAREEEGRASHGTEAQATEEDPAAGAPIAMLRPDEEA